LGTGESKALIGLNFNEAFDRVSRVLAAKGYAVQLSDRKDGTVTTEKKLLPFNMALADCGNILNLPLLKEKPDSMDVTYTVFLEAQGSKTAIRVTTIIEPFPLPSVHTRNQRVLCDSTGLLEKELLESIRRNP
jgi:hypothetical protein